MRAKTAIVALVSLAALLLVLASLVSASQHPVSAPPSATTGVYLPYARWDLPREMVITQEIVVTKIVETVVPRPPIPPFDLIWIAAIRIDGDNGMLVIFNRGGTAVDLGGWRMQSVLGDHWYTFPQGYQLVGLDVVRVHSGPSAVDIPPHDLMWQKVNVWSAGGGLARLYDSHGAERVSYCYGIGCGGNMPADH